MKREPEIREKAGRGQPEAPSPPQGSEPAGATMLCPQAWEEGGLGNPSSQAEDHVLCEGVQAGEWSTRASGPVGVTAVRPGLPLSLPACPPSYPGKHPLIFSQRQGFQ